MATHREGKSHLNAYLDDYAYLIDAILALLQCRWDKDWLDMAIQLADQLLASFEDKEHGGFFFTSHDHEQLIQRSKTFMDDAVPSGNGIAANTLTRFGHLLGESRYLGAAESTLKAAWPSIERYPSAHNSLLHLLGEHLQPPQSTIIRHGENDIQPWIECYREIKNPYQMFMCIPRNVPELPGILGKQTPETETVAYICRGLHCLEPVKNLDLLLKNLNNPV